VRPGDIVSLAPIYRALKVIRHLGNEQKAKDKVSVTLLEQSQLSQAVARGEQDSRFVVPGLLSWGVLLTRGCDIDNGKERQVAFLRPLRTFGDEKVQASIVDGMHTSLHYLPKPSLGDCPLEESVVDFRFVVTLHRDVFGVLSRPLSLTREAVLDIYFSWMKHATGSHVPSTVPCPTCKCPVEVFRAVADVANPSDDY